MTEKNILSTDTAKQKLCGTSGAPSNSAPENPDADTHKKTYRTRNTAGTISEIPDRLPVITSSTYQNALTFNKNSSAYLQPLSDPSQIKYENGTLFLKGLPATLTELISSCAKGNENIEEFNITLLRALYGIILTGISCPLSPGRGSDQMITIYYPDFARKIGRPSNINKNDVCQFIDAVEQFQTVVGVINNGAKNSDILPVLVPKGHDKRKKTVSFTSPYMARLAKDIYESGIRKKENGDVMLKKNGRPQMLPTYSYLISMGIALERNRKAVEIVFIVVALIEQAGNNTPHIRAKTIIDRNPLLHRSMEGQTAGNKNNLLKRAFVKAWQLLREKTFLTSAYKNIQLPDPDDTAAIPSTSTLGTVFNFPHEGKAKNS